MEDKAWVDVISGLEEEDLVTEEIINKLIADHEKAIKENRAEIKRSQRSIENLEYKKKKLKYGDNTIIFEVADTLHEKCHLIHDNTEVRTWDLSRLCPYFEATWDSYDTNPARLTYYNKAKNVIDKAKELNISIRKAIKLINEV